MRVICTLAPLALSIAGVLHAQNVPGYNDPNAPGYTQDDFGGVGLLQTPTARMSDAGEVSFDYSRIEPYTRLNVSGQPFSWLEGTFRYTIITDRVYPADTSAHPQHYVDKSIDLKVHLLSESRFLPNVAVGIQDIAGTGLFSSEYFVASKRAGPIDFSLGLAWGYLGGRGNLPNPFGWIDSNFNVRPVPHVTTIDTGYSASAYFHGPTALFGGAEYQTPLSWLRLKLELDGNNYQHEPQNNNQPQRWPVNFGALFRVSHFADVTLGYERGNTAMLSVSLHDNLAKRTDAPKPLDPAPEAVAAAAAQAASAATSSASASPTTTSASTGPQVSMPSATGPGRMAPAKTNWAQVSRILHDNAGITVSHVAQRGSELLVYGEQKRFFYASEGLGRVARLLNNRLDNSIDWITVVSESSGLPIVEFSVHRQRFVDYLGNDIDASVMRRSVELDPPAAQRESVLYTQPIKRWDFGLGPGYAQSLGGPNAPLLYQFTVNGTATYHFLPDLWLDTQVDVNVLNNYKNFTYNAPSLLPRVRTDARLYVESSNVVMPNFQLTGTRQLGTDLYGMAYAGMLESMFGGLGGEVLYRPLGDRWAVGADANFVRQRGFDQDFAFRSYQVATGQATLYVDTGFEGLNAALSAGRYLAGDWGMTLDFSRHFDNGVRMGAYATFTTAGSRYGEGGFDKGVYLSVPFDLFLPWSRNQSASFLYQPLLRDGGARLDKTYHLYDMTNDRDSDLFYENFDNITH
jgi:hypothetical protein